jgi:hypothetical protein
LFPNATDTIQKPSAVATIHRISAHLVGKGRVNADQPAALAQFQRHVNRGNLGVGGRRLIGSFSALFTLWLSMMEAVGLASRSAFSRHST